jgi:hypothetical protein
MICADCGKDAGTTHGWQGALGHTFGAPVPTANPRWDSQTCEVCGHQVYVAVTFFTVSFDSAGGTAVPSQTVRAGATIEQPANPTRANYNFTGWYFISPGWEFAYNFGVNTVGWDITLVATWVPIMRTITFDTVGGTAIESISVQQGTAFNSILPENPVRDGYKFLGWRFGVSGTHVGSGNFFANHDNTLVAMWEAITVVSVSNATFRSVANNSGFTTITFDVLVGFSDGSSETVAHTVRVAANNNNISGSFVFEAGHDLAGLTLTYDIRGNGSSIRAFSLV